MREVKVAKSAGFCFGVQRAVDMVYDEALKAAETGRKVYTLGPVIHNEQVVSDMESKGVCVIEDTDSIQNGTNTTVIIRSHGVSKDVIDRLKEKM